MLAFHAERGTSGASMAPRWVQLPRPADAGPFARSAHCIRIVLFFSRAPSRDRPRTPPCPSPPSAALEVADGPGRGRAGGGPAHRRRDRPPLRHPRSVPARPELPVWPGRVRRSGDLRRGVCRPVLAVVAPPSSPADVGTARSRWASGRSRRLALVVGYRPRLAALVCWLLAVSFQQSNPHTAQRRRPAQAGPAPHAELPAVGRPVGDRAATRSPAPRPAPCSSNRGRCAS